MIALLDHSNSPTTRETIGRLLSAAACADLAVAHVRLAAIDLQPRELATLQRLRLLLTRFDASFASDAHSLTLDPDSVQQLFRLLAFVDSGRVEVRSMRSALWTPDFSVFRGIGQRQEDVMLLGAHYFRQPFSTNGATFTCVIRDAGAVRKAGRRFAELWDQAYDVRGVIAETLSDALACAGAT